MFAAEPGSLAEAAVVGEGVDEGVRVTESEQDRALFDAWEAGDESARGKLIERLIRVAGKALRSYRRHPEFDDLMGEAMVAICESVDECRAGGTVASFAWFRCRARVSDFLGTAERKLRTMSIHYHSATELIEGWQRQGTQEDAVLFSEVRATAESVLPTKQFKVILRRALEDSRESIARDMRRKPSTVRSYESIALRAVRDRVL